MEEGSTERLARVIARSGRASRREAEKLIADGRVTVNGVMVLHPGHPVDAAHDHIKVEGRPLPTPAPMVYFLLYKPKDYITTRDDPEGRKSVLELVSHLNVRVEPVGRLDINTEGALLLTNDGELAHKLTHPSSEVPKRYLAKVYRVPSEDTLNRVRAGLRLEDGLTSPCKARVLGVTRGGNAWVEVTVTEGRNHLIRRLFAAVGHPVSKLRRETFATLSIRGLERGETRPLTVDEVARLRDIANGMPADEAGHSSRYKPGFARPKPKPNRPLSRKKAAAARGKRTLERPDGGPAKKR